METPRTPSRCQIIQNQHLTPSTRGRILGRLSAGQKPLQIAEEENLTRSQIKNCVRTFTKNQSCYRSPGTGATKVFDDRLTRRLLRIVRIDPKITYQNLGKELGIAVSKKTLYRVLKQQGITNWLAKKRPILTQKHAQQRLQFAKQYRYWSIQDWARVIWSDECSVERGSGKERKWCFRTPAQKWEKEMIETYGKGKALSIMVWGAFWGGQYRSDLVRMTRDEASKRNGYSAASYIGVLEDQLPTIYEPGLLFMQDNASIHTAKVIRKFFQDHAIELFEHPAVSPDLNPIEHMWVRLKEEALKIIESDGFKDQV